MTNLGNDVGRRRAAAGLRQQELAARAGISRQSLSLVEGGRSVPSATVALRLARALGCAMEDLFWVDDGNVPLTVELAPVEPDDGTLARSLPAQETTARRPATPSMPRGARSVPKGKASRVVLAAIDGKWVAHPLAGGDAGAFMTAADGVVIGGNARNAKGSARVTPVSDATLARDTLLCAGCAPAFGILAARANANRQRERVLWLDRSSSAALDLLAQGQVHVAGAHLYDEDTREFNVPFVQRRLPGQSMLIFNLARWEAGLVVAPGNPRRIRHVRDLTRPDVSFVRRQPGAAAQALVERLLLRDGADSNALSPARFTARGHMEVARLVALGVADVGVALAAVARAHGLDFIPLAEERFDLILAKERSSDPRVVRLLATLTDQGFRRELQSLGGHVARDAGRLIADTGLLS